MLCECGWLSCRAIVITDLDVLGFYAYCSVILQQLISQQKDNETEERQKIASERRDQQRQISQLVEETTNLKTELARYAQINMQSK